MEYKDIIRSYATNFYFIGVGPYKYSMEIKIRSDKYKHQFSSTTYIKNWQDILIGDFISSPSFEQFKRLEIIERRLDSLKKLGI